MPLAVTESAGGCWPGTPCATRSWSGPPRGPRSRPRRRRLSRGSCPAAPQPSQRAPGHPTWCRRCPGSPPRWLRPPWRTLRRRPRSTTRSWPSSSLLGCSRLRSLLRLWWLRPPSTRGRGCAARTSCRLPALTSPAPGCPWAPPPASTRAVAKPTRILTPAAKNRPRLSRSGCTPGSRCGRGRVCSCRSNTRKTSRRRSTKT